MSIAEDVTKWIQEHPFIRIGLKKELLNYSAIARIIQIELKIKNFDAILVSIRRYSDSITDLSYTDDVKELFSKASLEIRTGFNVYVCKNEHKSLVKDLISDNYVHIIMGSEYFVIITERDLKISYSKKMSGLTEIRIKCSPQIVDIPGVHMAIIEKLFEYNVNVIETYGSYTDEVVVIKKEDLTSALKGLNDLGIN